MYCNGIRQVAASLKDRFDEHINMVRDLRSVIERSLTSSTDLDVISCGKVDGGEYDSRFRRKVIGLTRPLNCVLWGISVFS